MTRTVADAALLLGALAGPDPADPATLAARGQADYTRHLAPDGLRGARLGVLRDLFGFHARVDALMEECLRALRSLGAELVDPLKLAPEPDPQVDANELIVLYYEYKDGLNRYLAGLGPAAPAHSLADVISFNEQHAERVMPHFGQEHLVEAERKGGLDTAEYLRARDTNHRIVRESIDRLLVEHQLEALIAPTGGPAWLTDHVNGDHYSDGGSGFSSPGAISGYPSLTVPAGFVAGLPVGLGFIGGAWQEGTLLRLGHAFEQGTQARRPPDLPD
jgi:amidase